MEQTEEFSPSLFCVMVLAPSPAAEGKELGLTPPNSTATAKEVIQNHPPKHKLHR